MSLHPHRPATWFARLAGLVIATALSAMALPSAAAADMSVNVCRHADGSPAPTDGFAFTIRDDDARPDTATDTCATGGSVQMQFTGGSHGETTGGISTGAVISWARGGSAPADIKRYLWWRASELGDPGNQSFRVEVGEGPGSSCIRGNTSTPCAGQGNLNAAPLDSVNAIETRQSVGNSAALIACSNSQPSGSFKCSEPRIRLRIYRLLYTLNDTTAPTVVQAAFASSTVRGNRADVSLEATDNLGVHTAQVVSDNDARTPLGAPSVINTNSGRCAAQADGSFDYVGACPGTIKQSTSLDVGVIRNGSQGVRIKVVDVSGNATFSGPITVTGDQTPRTAVKPSIKYPLGTLRPGVELGVNAGEWGPSGVQLTYQWLRCDASSLANCVEIVGATKETYTLDETDIGRSVAVRVTGTFAGYTGSATSDPSPALELARTGETPKAETSPFAEGPFTNPLAGKGHTHNGSGQAATGTVAAGFKVTSRVRVARIVKGRRRTSFKTVTAVRTRALVKSNTSLRLTGSLRGVDGTAIAGAILVIGARDTAGRRTEYGRVTTKADGSYEAKITWGPNRRLQVAWFPFADSRTPILSRELFADGRGRVKLSTGKATRSSGVTYRGTVLNAGAGTIVRLQARDGTRWLTILSPTTDKTGQFVARRKLRRTARGRLLCVRARVIKQGGFAYETAVSATQCTRVR